MAEIWQLLRAVLKWTGLIVLGLVALVVLLFAVLFAINIRDEPLTPLTQSLLAVAPDRYAPGANIYLAFAGFEAPAGAAVLAAGEARIDYYNTHLDAALARAPAADTRATVDLKDPQRLKFQGDTGFCHPLSGSMWQEIPAHAGEVAALLSDNRELYERYRALLGLRGYYETARPSYLQPMFYPAPPMHPLFLADVVLRLHAAAATQRQAAFADLKADQKLWHAVLVGNGALLSKMLSAAYLQADDLVLADVIADPHSVLPTDVEADGIVPVFDLTDWDIASAFAAEFRYQAGSLQYLSGHYSVTEPDPHAQSGAPGWLARLADRTGRHFLKLNATLNLFAGQTHEFMLASAPGGSKPGAALKARAAPALPRLSVYNPIGNALAWIARPAYAPYPARAWDGAALQRLVRLSYEIRAQGIAPAAIPAFMHEHPEWSTHPGDGRPFLWDAAGGALRVQTLGPHPPDRRFSIRVWQAAATG
jgi:hypothetical protein